MEIYCSLTMENAHLNPLYPDSTTVKKKKKILRGNWNASTIHCLLTKKIP